MSKFTDGYNDWRRKVNGPIPLVANAAYAAGYFAGHAAGADEALKTKMPPPAGTEERQDPITQGQYSAERRIGQA